MMQAGLAGVTTDMLVVFAIVVLALVFFATRVASRGRNRDFQSWLR